MKLRNFIRVFIRMAATIALASDLAVAQRAATCAGRLDCFEVAAFTANVTDFRVSGGNTKVVTATVRFLNKAPGPLIVGYVRGSGIVTDDQGNRYHASGPSSVRGIGEISDSRFDSKFALAPGEAGDARFEFTFTPRDEVLGTTYEIELAVREINPLPGNQFRLGKEYALSFRGFGSVRTAGASAAGAPPQPGTQVGGTQSATVAPTGATPNSDPCGDIPRCYNAGKFRANVTNVASSSEEYTGGAYHTIRLTVRIRNLTSQPLILAYRERSEQLIDDAGNRYSGDESNNVARSRVRGIGTISASDADPQFLLAPGEERDATFENGLNLNTRQARGNVFSFDLTLEELEVLPSRQVRSIRAYAVGFHDIRQNTRDRTRSILDRLRPTIKIQ